MALYLGSSEKLKVYQVEYQIVDAPETIKYSYNGYVLPQLPDSYEETYPYAVILTTETGYKQLRLCHGKYQYNGSYYQPEGEFTEWRYKLNDDSTEWVSDGDDAGGYMFGGTVLWASYDIFDVSENPLYNGVQLPDINEVWTDELKEQYPYVVISDAPESVTFTVPCYQLMISSSPTEVNSSGSRYHVSDAVAKRYVIVADSAELDAIMTENNMTDEDLEALLGVGRRSWLLMNEYDLYEAGFSIDSRPTNWANHDILNPDGTTYLAASEPTYPIYLSAKEPELVESNESVGENMNYLYNDMKLPALPEWDQEASPLAFIHVVRNDTGTPIYAQLITVDAVDHVELYYDGSGLKMVDEAGNICYASQRWVVALSEDTVEEAVEIWPDISATDWTAVETESWLLTPENLLWTNTTLYTDDGTLYLAASDPIPVSNSTSDTQLVSKIYRLNMLFEIPDEPSGVYE